MRYIFVLSGRAGSGKTTAARLLTDMADFERVRFAGPLKEMMHVLGLDERHTDGDLKEVPCDLLGGKTPRHAMQTIGNEWGRELIDKDLWVNAAIKRITDSDQDVVIDDCRYPNELHALTHIPNTTVVSVRVERESASNAAATHASESYVLPADVIIANNGTEDELWDRLHELFIDRVVCAQDE